MQDYLKQWRPAAKLRKGEHLKTPDGTDATADGGSTPADHDGWMWDLTVNDDHDFHVLPGGNGSNAAYYHVDKDGVTAVLVHNCQVAYGSTDLSQSVIQQRLFEGNKGNNYSAAWYIDQNGDEQIAVARSSEGRGNHAELKLLRQYGDSITEMYSEFQPCSGSNQCATKLADAGMPTSYSWDWTTSAEGAAARAAAGNGKPSVC